MRQLVTSNLGRWNSVYEHLTINDRWPYGDITTYQLAWEWLKNCALIEDWGCGHGYFASYCWQGQYRGIDGSCSPQADEIADLADYHSSVPAIMMRHVLEHDPRWRQILENALLSFQERMALIIFTPFAEKTFDMRPDGSFRYFSFRLADLTDAIGRYSKLRIEGPLRTATEFEIEHVFYLWKS